MPRTPTTDHGRSPTGAGVACGPRWRLGRTGTGGGRTIHLASGAGVALVGVKPPPSRWALGRASGPRESSLVVGSPSFDLDGCAGCFKPADRCWFASGLCLCWRWVVDALVRVGVLDVHSSAAAGASVVAVAALGAGRGVALRLTDVLDWTRWKPAADGSVVSGFGAMDRCRRISGCGVAVGLGHRQASSRDGCAVVADGPWAWFLVASPPGPHHRLT